MSGLCNGDAVCRINGADAANMTHDDAKRCVADADELIFGVKRGLYDPVLDEYEPIYEQIDQDDFDQPSQPTEEEILEIERKSSLLASAIDETIKSIEEYKEEVGIDTKKDIKVEESIIFKSSSEAVEEHTSSTTKVTIESPAEAKPIIYNGYAKVETRVFNNIENPKAEDEQKVVERQVRENSDELKELSKNIDVEVDVTFKVNSEVKSEIAAEVKHTVDTEQKTVDTKRDSIEADTSIEVTLPEITKETIQDITAEFTIRSDSMSNIVANGETSQIIEEKPLPISMEQVQKTIPIGMPVVSMQPKVTNGVLEVSTTSDTNGVSEIFAKPLTNGASEILAKPVSNGASEILAKAVSNGASEILAKAVSNGASEILAKSVRNGVPEDNTTPVTNGVPEIYSKSGVPEVSTAPDTNGVPVSTKSEMNGYTEISEKFPITNGIPKAVIEKPSSMFRVEEKKDPMSGYRPIQFDPEEIKATKRNLQSIHLSVQPPTFQRAQSPSYVDSKGELLGTHQGIVDGLEEAIVDADIAKELGKPGLTETKIAELISGESEMLREAHVMGLSRVLKSHMHRADDDSSVDFKKIKPLIESLKYSEVLKVLNEEIERAREEKRKEEEKKWTTFLQKPKRPVPKSKFGYPGWVEEEKPAEPYKVKIVKQPKPKVAPDYKPKNFETGPLPWEERALNEPPPPPVEAEDPILIPEELPEFLEAVDPLPESEVPDLEDTGIPLPPPEPVEETTPSPAPEEEAIEEPAPEPLPEEPPAAVEETEAQMEQNKLAEQLLMGVQSMVDPNASVEQQLAQMRAQMAALAQLPSVIQQTLDAVTRQLSQLSTTEISSQVTEETMHSESHEEIHSESHTEMRVESHEQNEMSESEVRESEDSAIVSEESEQITNGDSQAHQVTIVEVKDEKPSLTQEELEKLRREEEEMLEEQRRIEKQKKEMMDQMKLEQESRQVKQRPTPRVGKPKQVFGPPTPVARPLVLPGGRKWRKPEDAYNEAFFAETLASQAELIQGKTMGINFMKYEKPPVSLDHLQHSETYKLIHNMEQTQPKRVEMLTPVICEADYREKCRSVTPSMCNPQQVQP